MKKLSLLAAICLTMNALNGMSQTTDAWPWDFPMSTGEQLTDGELVLAPYTYYKVAIDDKEDLKRKGLIFYKTKLETAGSEKSVVNYMEDYELPNTLIIGLPEGATAKKGDILLTWWQSGSGMKRAIVRDDSNPAEPKVDYLDMDMRLDNDGTISGLAERNANEQLKPNSFIVLRDGEWAPGAQVACKNERDEWNAATLIKATKDKVLVSGFSSRLSVYPKDDCRLIPMSDEDMKAGDTVWCVWVGTYQSGYTVDKVDKERGRVWVTDSRGNHKILSILEVTKVLD